MIERYDVVIVGGGLAGLSAAHRLHQHAPVLNWRLFEASERFGGKIRTDYVDHDDGQFVIEAGPDSFVAQKPWLRELATDLGLAGDLVPTNYSPHPVAILKHGRLIDLPAGVALIAPTQFGPTFRSPLLSLADKIRLMGDLVRPARNAETDESLASFVTRRFGRGVLDWIAEPIAAGIYNADPASLSLAATFPHLQQIERQQGSVIRGLRTLRRRTGPVKTPFLTLGGGMQSLVDALVFRLGARLESEANVTAVEGHDHAGYRVSFDGRSAVLADQIIVATPPAIAAPVLSTVSPLAADGLEKLNSADSAIVTLACRTADIRRPLRGYGLVLPAAEHRPINAVTVSSRKIANRAPAGWELIRVFVGGYRSPDSMRLDDHALLGLVQNQLADLLGLTDQPAFRRIQRWLGAGPQYEPGHLARIAAIEAALPPGVHITGGALHGVGLPDVVHHARQTADRVLSQFGAERIDQSEELAKGIPSL